MRHLPRELLDDDGDPRHGTYARYVSKRLRCRCDMCRRAATEYMARWRHNGSGRQAVPVEPVQPCPTCGQATPAHRLASVAAVGLPEERL